MASVQKEAESKVPDKTEKPVTSNGKVIRAEPDSTGKDRSDPKNPASDEDLKTLTHHECSCPHHHHREHQINADGLEPKGNDSDAHLVLNPLPSW